MDRTKEKVGNRDYSKTGAKSTERLKKDSLPDAWVRITPIPHIWTIVVFSLKNVLDF